MLIGEEKQPLITDFALAKARYVDLLYFVYMSNLHSHSSRVT